MAEVVAGWLTSALVKIAGDKLSSALNGQATLALNFNDDLEYMKGMMESMEAVFKDAEKQSVKSEVVRLWLKRLKAAALDISDMMNDYQDTDISARTKMPRMLTTARKKRVLAKKMKNMRERLRKINEEAQTFNMIPSPAASQDQQHSDEHEIMSAGNEAIIFGRDREKKEIIEILSASHKKDGTMVVPIYGLGGIGKSTLARLVYDDIQFKQYDGRVWVYVSEVFNLKKIGNSILSQLSTDGGQQNLDTFHRIREHLDKLLPNKKILIVLDDIWQEEALELRALKKMLHVEKKGSMVDVLVTTRSKSIAKKICTNEPYKLQPLTHNVCWDIIKRNSGFENKSNKPKLEEVGLDLAKKCGGVALAAQVLGNMLYTENLDGWLKLNKNDIWNESFGGDDDSQCKNKVLPSLKLSCERMVPKLRLCFSYCAIFPKGHDIYEDDLVHQWIALDFIKEPSDGKKYIKQLLGMSFFQHSKLPAIVTYYTMHDLVHDLARLVVDDELIVIDAARKIKTSVQEYCRFALLTNYDGQTKLSNILPKKVRALHFCSSCKLGPHDDSFSFMKHLRILDFRECSGILLPSSIAQLKHFKCLIAPKVQNKSLPKAVAKLSKLQYLNLRESSVISALPESIGKLSFLIYLDLSQCSGILKVPEPFGGLKSLVHLDMSYCSGITGLPGSLGNMTNLQHLNLRGCSGVKEIPESLGGLTQLQYLNLSYCAITRLPEAIGSLTNLQYLDLKGTDQIREVPGSFQNLQNLVHLDLRYCACAKGLPKALRCLTSLGHLELSGFQIDNSFRKDLFDAMGNLTNLEYLNIASITCYLDFISTLTNLEHLVLSGNSGLVSLPECIGNLKKLHTLKITECERLESLPDSIGNLKKLHTLDLRECRRLKSLPDSIREIAALKSLLVVGCSSELIDQVTSKFDGLLSLPLFIVHADVVSGCSNFPLLEFTNVSELRICSLENVWSVEEAHKVKLLDKSNLLDLTLEWTALSGHRFVDDEDLLGQLQPPTGLNYFVLDNYNGQSFPSWVMKISRHLPNLVEIILTLPKCSNLPPLGQLPNLKKLVLAHCPRVTKIDKDFCGGQRAFRQLSTFFFSDMEGLEEWSTTYFDDDGVEEFMFPMLDQLHIQDCPMLRLKPCAPIFRQFTLQRSDQVISSLEELGNSTGHLMSSSPRTILTIRDSKITQSPRIFHHFTALQELVISSCGYVGELPESMRHLVSLQELYLGNCEGISALPEWLCDLSSLKCLTIKGCQRIRSLPPSIQQRTKILRLCIRENKELKHWCESDQNKKKLTHILITADEESEEELEDLEFEEDLDEEFAEDEEPEFEDDGDE